MTQGGNDLHFFYDVQNRPAVVVYNGTAYAYVKNLQGDIVGILDNAGNWVVEYTYDAWGAPTSRTGSMADTLGVINPFRYRSYVYDQETGLYYLRSRYYNPVWCRFVNADTFVGRKAPINHAVFTYCHNNPIVYMDSLGKEAKKSAPEFGKFNPPKFFSSFLNGEIDINDSANVTKIERVATHGWVFYYDVAYQYTLLSGDALIREQSSVLKASSQADRLTFWDGLDAMIAEATEVGAAIGSISEKHGLLSKQLRSIMEEQLSTAATQSLDNNTCVVKFECTWRYRYHWFYGFEYWLKEDSTVMYFEYNDWLNYLKTLE